MLNRLNLTKIEFTQLECLCDESAGSYLSRQLLDEKCERLKMSRVLVKRYYKKRDKITQKWRHTIKEKTTRGNYEMESIDRQRHTAVYL